jgi:hypothetical protein
MLSSICREFTNLILKFMHKKSEFTTNQRAFLNKNDMYEFRLIFIDSSFSHDSDLSMSLKGRNKRFSTRSESRVCIKCPLIDISTFYEKLTVICFTFNLLNTFLTFLSRNFHY